MKATRNMNVGDLADLLQIQKDHQDNVVDAIDHTGTSRYLKANKSATLDDFVAMVAMLVKKTMKKDAVEFVPDEGARIELDPKKTLDHPYILFDVISRIPMTELKPRAREVIEERTDDKANARSGMVWGQRQKVIVQFNILACDYVQANRVMNNLEELIFKYTAYLKKNGVAEILFQMQGTDRNLDYYRQSSSVRSLQYMIEIEKLFVQFDSDIEDATILGFQVQ